MSTKSLRILCRFTWPTGEVSRLWDGAGPFMDSDGDIWAGCTLLDGLDEIEQAINGEASTLIMALTGEGQDAADLVWVAYTEEQIVGATVQILIQPCDAAAQPIGSRDLMFTGRIDNIIYDDTVAGERPRSTMTVEVTNRFSLRRLTNGGVLSDADQRARSAAVNPDAPPDRFCERVPMMADKTITWPRWR